jgi:hypothetical protein
MGLVLKQLFWLYKIIACYILDQDDSLCLGSEKREVKNNKKGSKELLKKKKKGEVVIINSGVEMENI